MCVWFRSVRPLHCVSECLSGASGGAAEPQPVQNADDGLGVGHAAAANHGVPSHDRGGQVLALAALRACQRSSAQLPQSPLLASWDCVFSEAV